jgi:hypothetical protein
VHSPCLAVTKLSPRPRHCARTRINAPAWFCTPRGLGLSRLPAPTRSEPFGARTERQRTCEPASAAEALRKAPSAQRAVSAGSGRGLSVRPHKLPLAILTTLCMLAGGMAFTSVPALAAAPEIVAESESVTEVTATSATLNASVDPESSETSYHFEYGTSAAYGAKTPETALLASDNTDHPTSVPIQDLASGSVYHYRVVASNSAGPAYGTDHTFTTQQAAGGSALPDDREYELVSPAEKDGAEVLGIVDSNGQRARGVVGGSAATQASEDGAAITYVTSGPVGSNPPPGNLYASQIVSTRGADGWDSQDVSNPHSAIRGFVFNKGEEYRLFSADLSSAVVQAPGTPANTVQPPLAPEIQQETNANEIYVRNNASSVFQAVLPEALLRPAPEFVPELEGASPDLAHLVFSSSTRTAPSTTYEWSGGSLQPVNVLPGGHTLSVGGNMEEGVALGRGFGEDPGRHAISDDGAHVVWTGEGDLFTRNMVSEETVQVDLTKGGAGPSGSGVFEGASSDGSRVFFTDEHELTSGAHAGDLYEFDVPDQALTDLTPSSTGGEVIVVGSSEAGTELYIDSTSVLTHAANGEGETAAEGSSNLYALHEAPVDSGSWSTTFVATLSPEDASAMFFEGTNGAVAELGGRPMNLAMRVSPNGRYLAFMSNRSLTGYDNEDVTSEHVGERRDEEVYLYDAETSGLVCASCDPTGARPRGEYDAGNLAMDPTHTWLHDWLAALIPGWNYNRLPSETYHESERSLYQSRALSDSGRLFFDSADALVPEDDNGRVDVYEYEPNGEGSCSASPGCVALISGGNGGDDSTFVDASASGDDVFFVTSDRLVTQDQDGVTDMYDASVCGAAATHPCLASVTTSSPPCTTADSCRAAQSPQPGIFGSPASATFTGSSNVPPAVSQAAKAQAKPKPLTRAQRLAAALKLCRKERVKAKRAGCERAARKRYGPVKAEKAGDKRRAKS